MHLIRIDFSSEALFFAKTTNDQEVSQIAENRSYQTHRVQMKVPTEYKSDVGLQLAACRFFAKP